MSKRRYWVQWRCSRCGRTDKFWTRGVYQSNKRYTYSAECCKCGKENKITIDILVDTPWN